MMPASTPPEPSPFSTRFDARVTRRWRPLWLAFKWSFAALGTYLLVGHFVMTWGWAAGLWFLLAPALHGLSLRR